MSARATTKPSTDASGAHVARTKNGIPIVSKAKSRAPLAQRDKPTVPHDDDAFSFEISESGLSSILDNTGIKPAALPASASVSKRMTMMSTAGATIHEQNLSKARADLAALQSKRQSVYVRQVVNEPITTTAAAPMTTLNETVAALREKAAGDTVAVAQLPVQVPASPSSQRSSATEYISTLSRQSQTSVSTHMPQKRSVTPEDQLEFGSSEGFDFSGSCTAVEIIADKAKRASVYCGPMRINKSKKKMGFCDAPPMTPRNESNRRFTMGGKTPRQRDPGSTARRTAPGSAIRATVTGLSAPDLKTSQITTQSNPAVRRPNGKFSIMSGKTPIREAAAPSKYSWDVVKSEPPIMAQLLIDEPADTSAETTATMIAPEMDEEMLMLEEMRQQELELERELMLEMTAANPSIANIPAPASIAEPVIDLALSEDTRMLEEMRQRELALERELVEEIPASMAPTSSRFKLIRPTAFRPKASTSESVHTCSKFDPTDTAANTELAELMVTFVADTTTRSISNPLLVPKATPAPYEFRLIDPTLDGDDDDFSQLAAVFPHVAATKKSSR